jgi:hypothetical protein
VVAGVSAPVAAAVVGETADETARAACVLTSIAACAASPALGARNGEPESAAEEPRVEVAAATTVADHGIVVLAVLPVGIGTGVDGRPASFLASCLPASRILGDTVLAELGATPVCFVSSAAFK